MEKGFIVIKAGTSKEEFEKIMAFLEWVKQQATEVSEDEQ